MARQKTSYRSSLLPVLLRRPRPSACVLQSYFDISFRYSSIRRQTLPFDIVLNLRLMASGNYTPALLCLMPNFPCLYSSSASLDIWNAFVSTFQALLGICRFTSSETFHCRDGTQKPRCKAIGSDFLCRGSFRQKRLASTG